MFRSRNPHLPVGFRIINGHIAPTEYCAIKLGMAMFRNAHQYFYMVSKNIEAYEKLATELDDGEFLTDSELFSLVVRIVKSSYNTDSLRNLTQSQKLDLARKLRSELAVLQWADQAHPRTLAVLRLTRCSLSAPQMTQYKPYFSDRLTSVPAKLNKWIIGYHCFERTKEISVTDNINI